MYGYWIWASHIKSHTFCPVEAWIKAKKGALKASFELVDWVLWHSSFENLKARELELLAQKPEESKEKIAKDLQDRVISGVDEITRSNSNRNGIITRAQEVEGKNYDFSGFREDSNSDFIKAVRKASQEASKRIKHGKIKINKGTETYWPITDIKFLKEQTVRYPEVIPSRGLAARPDFIVAAKLDKGTYYVFPLDVKKKIYTGDVLQNVVGYTVIEGNLKWLRDKLGISELEMAPWHSLFSYMQGEDVAMKIDDQIKDKVRKIGEEIRSYSPSVHPMRQDFYEKAKCDGGKGKRGCLWNELCKHYAAGDI